MCGSCHRARFSRENCDAPLCIGKLTWYWKANVKTIYYPEEDILKLVFSDQPIVKEISQDWNLNISYSMDGGVVEIVVLDAVTAGLIPFHSEHSKKVA